jgi:hypothetical protein
MSEIGEDGKIVFDQRMAENLYTHFVWYMHAQWGGPAAQRTPTTNTLDAMATMLRARDDEGFCYALCAEYLSNHRQPNS